MQVLCALAEGSGRVVSRDELIERCWNGRVVGEDSISRCIARLRHLASEEPGGFEITTLTRIGYQLSAQEGSQAEPAASKTPGGRRRWLPFLLSAIMLLLAGAAVWLIVPAPHWQIDRIKPLVASERGVAGPALSLHHHLLAYTAQDEAETPHIYLRNLEGGGRIQLTRGNGESRAKWFPKGERLAFQASSEMGARCRIMAMTVPAGQPRELVRCNDDGPLDYAFSPDERFLYYTDRSGTGTSYKLMRRDLAGGATTALTDPVGRDVTDTVGEISPDGRYLAFQRRYSTAGGKLMVLDLRSGGTRVLWPGARDKWETIAWLDDRTLIVSWHRADDRALIAVSLDGERRRLTSATQSFQSLSRGADGRFAVLANFGAQSLVNFDARHAPVTLIESDGLVADPAYASDGTLAVIADNAGEQSLWIGRAGAPLTRIAGFGSDPAYHPAWSPNGRLIAITQLIERTPFLKILDREGNVRRNLRLPGVDAGQVIWSPDGRTIGIASQDLRDAGLVDVDVATGRASAMADRGFFQFRGDGAARYAVKSNQVPTMREIWELSPDRRLLSRSLMQRYIGVWTVFRGDLYIVEMASGQPRLVRRTPAGRIVQSWPLQSTPWLGGVAIDPLSGAPAIVQASGERNDIYLITTSRRR